MHRSTTTVGASCGCNGRYRQQPNSECVDERRSAEVSGSTPLSSSDSPCMSIQSPLAWATSSATSPERIAKAIGRGAVVVVKAAIVVAMITRIATEIAIAPG